MCVVYEVCVCVCYMLCVVVCMCLVCVVCVHVCVWCLYECVCVWCVCVVVMGWSKEEGVRTDSPCTVSSHSPYLIIYLWALAPKG